MLRLSKLADYATVILSYMARTASDLHSALEIADVTGIGLPTVSKILKLLVNAHILTSVRGVKGGYRLARGAEKISVASIITALDGPIAITECSISAQHCDQSNECRLRANWGLINRTINNALEAVSLADMATPLAASEEITIPVSSLYR